MDQTILPLFRQFFSDLSLDWEESQALVGFLKQVNPPPDTLVKLRANAFRVGCEFLSDDKDTNVALLRTINAAVHAIETTCMEPKSEEGTAVEGAKLEEFYNGIYEDLSVSLEENNDLASFFLENLPDKGSLVTVRALAFKAGCNYISDDKNKNIQLLRCINVVVHAFEGACLRPKKYELKLAPSIDVDGLSLSEAAQHLWDLDANRLTPDDDYVINVQKGKKPSWKEDSARDPLFTRVDKSAFNRPTYKKFIALLDNYSANVGEAEKVTSTELRENSDFLSAILQTSPMQFCHKYCHAKNPSKVPADRAGFTKVLNSIWFELYNRVRRGKKDSSGFEHVFVGEVKDGSVTGFHNWIMFYLEEKKGKLDYRGYIKPKGSGEASTDENDHVLTFQFSWEGVEKFVGTSFVGVSPEFEMALYTMCFLVGEEENEIELNTGTDVFGLKIKCFKMGGDKIGTCYPEMTSHYDE